MASPPSPVDIARRLVTFPTVNPPGNEAAAQAYLRELLEETGLEVEDFERVEGRPNLVARLPGRVGAPPLILHGHVDVVGVDGQRWSRPPFAGRVEDGMMYGRGTLDMKSGVAMMAHALLRAASEGIRPSGDVVLAMVVDSETGGSAGMAYLLEHHPGIFSGARYAIGEFGGFPLHAFGRRFYRIGVSQKQYLHLRLRVTGEGGHGSRPNSATVIGRLGDVLSRLNGSRMPYHCGALAEEVVRSMAAALPGPEAERLLRLLDEETFEEALGGMGRLAPTFEALFRDSANPTIVSAGVKFNVAPSEAVVEVDARLLPGSTPGEAIDDLRNIVDAEDLEVEVVAAGPPATDGYDDGLFDTLADILAESDPEAVVVPYLFSESPDGRLFADHGVQHYGFLPMDLPADIDLPHLIHGADERVPISAIEFGAEALYRLVTLY